MSKIILNLAVSLDGFIARKDGSVDWLDNLDTGGSDLGFPAFLEGCDTLIMGRNSYEVTLALGNGTWPFKNHKSYVFTSKNFENTDYATFLNGSLVDEINKIKKSAKKNIWLFGGASFIKQLRQENLVDEYLITTIPVFIGSGIKLFDDVNNEVALELMDLQKANNILSNHYRVIK